MKQRWKSEKNSIYRNLNEYYENGNQLLRNRDNTAADTQNKAELYHLLAEESNFTHEIEYRLTVAYTVSICREHNVRVSLSRKYRHRLRTERDEFQVQQGHHLYTSSIILGQERNLVKVGFLTSYAALYDIIL